MRETTKHIYTDQVRNTMRTPTSKDYWEQRKILNASKIGVSLYEKALRGWIACVWIGINLKWPIRSERYQCGRCVYLPGQWRWAVLPNNTQVCCYIHTFVNHNGVKVFSNISWHTGPGRISGVCRYGDGTQGLKGSRAYADMTTTTTTTTNA